MSTDLTNAGVARRYEAGSLIFAEGDPAGPVFVVVTGQVSLHVGPDDALVGAAGPGDIVGELSAIDNRPRSASAIAATDAEVRAVSPPEFAAILERDPALALHLVRDIAAKFRQATESRSELVGGLPVGALAAAIRARSSKDPDGQIPVADLAPELDSSREDLSRSIDYLCAVGAIAVERARVRVLDATLLAEVEHSARARS